MPEMDFDTITLGHGSGGSLTNRLLEQGVFKVLGNELLDSRHDGAVFDLEGPLAFSTDSFVISPIFFPGGNIGELAINGTVNDLAMCGASPMYLSLGFILEEGLPMKEFWQILNSIRSAAEAAGVKIVTGDTKVVERGKGDKIYINTTGVGTLLDNARIDSARVKKGDAILLSNDIAAHGMAIMSIREGLEFETDILSDTKPLNHVVVDLLKHFGEDIHLLKDPTRGGVASVLNEVAQATNLGMHLDEKKLPMQDQVKAACEILGLDPLYVANEGVFIAIVNGAYAGEMIKFLKNYPASEHACAVGEVVSTHPRQVMLRSRIGGRRVVNMLPGQQLPRIC